MASLHGRFGGKKTTKQHVPAESEALALAVGCAMHWCKLRNSAHPDFFTLVAQKVKELEGTLQSWSHSELVDLFHEKVLSGIGQGTSKKGGLKHYLQREFANKDQAARDEAAKEFVQCLIYRFLATAKAGVDFDEAMKLAQKANLQDVLQCKIIGGKSEWRLEDFIQREVWEACGEQVGMQEVSIKFMTVVCAGSKLPPVNPMCIDCGELKCMHKGDRLNLVVVPCKCDTIDASAATPATMDKREGAGTKRTRGFDEDLDPTRMAQGMVQTNMRKLALIEKRYSGLSPREILKKLLGKDVMADEQAGASNARDAVPVTGEQGGRILACYLYSLEQSDDGDDFFTLDYIDTKAWLKAQQPRFLLYPAQKVCIEQALKFLPKLKAGLAAAADAANMDEDEDEDEAPEPVF